jgi:hypothetical protein
MIDDDDDTHQAKLPLLLDYIQYPTCKFASSFLPPHPKRSSLPAYFWFTPVAAHTPTPPGPRRRPPAAAAAAAAGRPLPPTGPLAVFFSRERRRRAGGREPAFRRMQFWSERASRSVSFVVLHLLCDKKGWSRVVFGRFFFAFCPGWVIALRAAPGRPPCPALASTRGAIGPCQ